MLLQVIYIDKHYDYVKDFMLDNLIESQKIARFRRSTGWVTIGVDPVRKIKNKRTYDGIERRAAVASLYPINIEVI